ncbi:uncharacterized protein LOC109890812 isoform X2 [Oncorhynchus kisutch]|uniref:uncharacterized protein LOC109890812 isoform X2 n=1 Tax=Oncorhynchus kisutch TaxID=8019 RepID=UPI00099FBE14|nr:uncharacterized protein LOC109890812 isoform X2 [Oncorhynchus kisutch]
MTKLQFLNVFLTEKLMLAAQDIYKQVEETILEYQEEIFQGKRENDKLRRKLHDNGIPWPDQEPFSPVESEEEEGAIGHKQEPDLGQTLEKQEGRARREEKLFRGLAPLSRFVPSDGNDDYDQNPPQPTSHQFQIQTHTGKTIEGGFLSSSTTSNPIKTETDRLGVCPLDDTSSDPNTFSSGNLDLSAAQSENSDYENTDDFWCCAVWKESKEEVKGVVPSTWVMGRKVISPPANGRKVLKERHKPGANWTAYDLIKIKLFSESLEECEGYSRSSDELTDNGDNT